MKDKHIWVGYLTLANKKVLVASDERVDAVNGKSMLLYNQERDEIVEYSREIIQAKLKAAPEADYDAAKIAAAYQKALRNKKPNLYRIIFTPNAGGGAAPKKKPSRANVEADDLRDDDIAKDFELDDGNAVEEEDDEGLADKD